MNDLDLRARAIVEAARQGDAPSRTDQDRIKKAILVQLAAGAALSTGAAVSTATAATLSVAAKVGLTVLAVSVAGGGVATYVKIRNDHHTAVVRRAHEPAEAARLAPPPLEEARIVESPAPPAVTEEPRRPERQRRAGPFKDDVLRREDRLSAEVDLLKQARHELRLGRPTQALQVLADYQRRFGDGMLAEERRALTAIAVCQADPGPAAQTAAEAFLRSAPRSPLAARVRTACAAGAGEAR